MKRVVRVCLALLLGVLMTVNVFADAGMAQYPDYATDYYMIVESPDGGIDFYAEASYDSAKLNTELIPNGTAFHIEGELKDASQRVWGYTKYHGMTGYIPLDDCKMVTRSEAIRSELSIAETAPADYDYTTSVAKILYNGPGEKFGKVYGSIEIPAGTTVHIVKEAKLADGSFWGYTFYEYEGWIRLESLVNIVDDIKEAIDDMNGGADVSTDENDVIVDSNENGNTEGSNVIAGGEAEGTDANGAEVNGTDVNGAEVNGTDVNGAEIVPGTAETLNGEENEGGTAIAAEPTATNTPTPKPTATNTPTPKPTATNTPTPDPTATNTPTPDPTATNTPTPDATATNTPTPDATATSTPTVEPTATTEPTVTMAPTVTEEAEEAPTPEVTDAAEEVSGENVEEASWMQNPIVWIGGICLLLIIILLIYHFVKKNK